MSKSQRLYKKVQKSFGGSEVFRIFVRQRTKNKSQVKIKEQKVQKRFGRRQKVPYL